MRRQAAAKFARLHCKVVSYQVGKEKASDNGFIMLHRKITEWGWYTNVNTAHLFIHCLLKANHKGKVWQGVKVERGSFVTSLNKLSVQTGLSVQAVRTALMHLKSTGEITCENKNRYTVIYVTNYNNYQLSTRYQQAINKQTNKRSNKVSTSFQQLPIMNNNDNKVYPPAPVGAEGDIQNKAALPAAPFRGAPPAAEKPKTREVLLWFNQHGYSDGCAGDFISDNWSLNPNPDYTDWKSKALKYAEKWKQENYK